MNPCTRVRRPDTGPGRQAAARARVAPAVATLWIPLLLSGAAQAGVSTQWASGAPRDHTYSLVLVVGVTPDANQRCQFEQFMADQLSGPSTQVIQSCNVSATVTPPTRANIEQAVKTSGADAVLASMLVKVQEAEQTGGTRDTRGGDYFKAEGEADVPGGVLGFYDVPVVYGQEEQFASVSVVEGKLEVTSRFYATQGPTLICTLDTVVKDVESSDDGVAAVTEALANRLRSDKLVR
jgi:hypothetical protein